MSEIRQLKVGPGESDNEKFGELLYTLRTRSRITRSDAALRLGTTSEYIRLIEKGRRTPPLGRAIQILDTYAIIWQLETSDYSTLIFENVSVIFTSRIKEARETATITTTRKRSSGLSREEMIVRIITGLVSADDKTIKKIHSKLYTYLEGYAS